jgi:hypothetical protein
MVASNTKVFGQLPISRKIVLMHFFQGSNKGGILFLLGSNEISQSGF